MYGVLPYKSIVHFLGFFNLYISGGFLLAIEKPKLFFVILCRRYIQLL